MTPLTPPIAPMLASLARELPRGPYLYEPKWDGFRCMAFVEPAAGDATAAPGAAAIDLRSRHGKPLGRYFPEVVTALAALPTACVLDGELVIPRSGGLDFAALMNRTHPAASRVARLATETPATYIAFDLLAIGDEDLTAAPFEARRARLERLLAGAPPTIRLTEATADPVEAERWAAGGARGAIDGVVAKRRDLPYAPGKRAMIKVKPERTVDCVVGGMRLVGDGEPEVASLLLGLWDRGELRHIGVCSTFRRAERTALLALARPDIVPLAGHPWERGFHLERSPMGRLPGAAGRWVAGEVVPDWIPLAPRRVVEVGYDHLDGERFRHPARFVRWRPDREPASCSFEQLR